MDHDRRTKHAASFGAGADVYERARPTYPDDAIGWLMPRGARRVLDLGAGTGKLTLALVARGLDVVAVDPSVEMLERLRRALPNVETHVGTAEAIPLDDASVDAVLVGQAWHWVEPARAVPEVARVLAPGGTLGLVWNIRDTRAPWAARLGALIEGDTPLVRYQGEPEVGPPFAPLERFEVPWTYRLDEAGLVDLVASRSFTLVRSPAARAAFLDEIRAAFHELPKAPDDPERIDLPYVTHCFRAWLSG